jgi:hypothetical protein
MALHAAVFLTTLSGLVFEIGLTRIYSATIWYHFAFLAVSVALLGWGLGGVVLHSLRRRLTPTLDMAAVLTLLYAAAIPLCLWLIVQFPFRLERLPLYFLAPLLPFLLAGTDPAEYVAAVHEPPARPLTMSGFSLSRQET